MQYLVGMQEYCYHTGWTAIETLLTIDESGPKIAKNSVFDCLLSPLGRQMAIKNSVFNDFHLRSSIALTFSIAICRQLGDKWQSKTLLLTILIYVRQQY